MSQGQTQMTVFQKNYANIKGLLEKNKEAITAVATKHLDVERLTKLALTEFRRTPNLVMCDPVSVVASLIQAAQVGLEPGGVLGRCYLVPFRNKHRGNREECQLIVGYKGMIELAYRSGQVESVEGDVVYEGDLWKARKGLQRVLEHERRGRRDPAKITHAYAIIRMRNGGVLYDYLNREEIEDARQASAASDNGPWVHFYGQMAVKTVIRRLFKFTPASSEVATAVAFEEMSEAGFSAAELIDVEIKGAEPAVVEAPAAPVPSLPASDAPVNLSAPSSETLRRPQPVPHHQVNLGTSPPTVTSVPPMAPKRKSSLDRHLQPADKKMTIRMANGNEYDPNDGSGGVIQ